MKSPSDDMVRLIFFPFIRIALGFIGVYTLLDYGLVIRKGVNQQVDEDIFLLLLPVILPWIPVLIWLRPRVELLNLTNQNRNVYLLLAVLAIAFPTFFLQEYVETATGKRTDLAAISQIAEKPATLYYTIQHDYVAKQWAQVESYSRTNSKRSSYTFHYDIIAPLFDRPGGEWETTDGSDRSTADGQDRAGGFADSARLPDSISGKEVLVNNDSFDKNEPIHVRDSLARVSAVISRSKAWIGVSYTKTIGSQLEMEQRDGLRKEFVEASWKDFEQKDFNKTMYWKSMVHTDERKEYEYLLAVSPSPPTRPVRDIIILEARMEPFSRRSGDRLVYTFLAFTVGAAVWGFILLFYNINAELLEAFQKGR